MDNKKEVKDTKLNLLINRTQAIIGLIDIANEEQKADYWMNLHREVFLEWLNYVKPQSKCEKLSVEKEVTKNDMYNKLCDIEKLLEAILNRGP